MPSKIMDDGVIPPRPLTPKEAAREVAAAHTMVVPREVPTVPLPPAAPDLSPARAAGLVRTPRVGEVVLLQIVDGIDRPMMVTSVLGRMPHGAYTVNGVAFLEPGDHRISPLARWPQSPQTYQPTFIAESVQGPSIGQWRFV